ncbi:AAA family ATPase [Brucella intermedia]|uniref:AAA family ATPase n=1 Tax=Brucella intermedia TaxID=94625 RepID=UPI00124E8D58|nr:AAA family ATPase [Brucella intermedia]KAB2710631.1 AAA family ATPase [Brucella intermedia]
MSISYRVCNLRRIREMPFIELRPLTILVGRNSAGKSTFLRSLPLLRQSIETKASAPILWWGDYVDFGNFESAAHDRDREAIISFDFRITDFQYLINDYSYGGAWRSSPNRNVKIDTLQICHGVKLSGSATQRAFIEISSSAVSESMRIEFDESPYMASSILIDGFNITSMMEPFRLFVAPDSIFGLTTFTTPGSKDELFGRTADRYQVFFNLIQKTLRKNIKRNLSDETFAYETRRILTYTEITSKEIDLLSRSPTQSIKKLYKEVRDGKKQEFLRSINHYCQAHHLIEALQHAARHLTNYFSQVEYIGPARARSERYYRLQELQVSDISPDGTNLPIFLASLSSYELESFSRWVESKFGYGIEINKAGSHVSIDLIQSGQRTNVVDTGYGVSQVLPVLAQVWWMRQRGRRFRQDRTNNDSSSILAIEQPELHLHPAHQAMLAEAFMDSLDEDKSRERPISLIIETHSEALINRIGGFIAEREMNESSVQIAVFGGDDSKETVSIATFDEEGMLNNWPHGFFNY